MRIAPAEVLRRGAGRYSLPLYLGGIVAITAFLTACMLLQARNSGIAAAWSPQVAYWALLPIGLLSLLGSSQLAVSLVNWLATLLVKTHPLPKMDFTAGIPAGCCIEGETLHLTPCLPADWPGLQIHYRFRETMYHIAISQVCASEAGNGGVSSVKVDGVEQHDRTIPLVDDHREHAVTVVVNAVAVRVHAG